MQINLKQPEIEAALRAYVVNQGISLHGKDVSIAFTAGRKESGISAEISIEETEIPGFGSCSQEAEEVRNVAQVVQLQPVFGEESHLVDEPQPEVQAPVQVEPAEVAETKTTSLFG